MTQVFIDKDMISEKFPEWTDLNYVEDSAGGPDVTVGILPKLDKVTLLQVITYPFIAVIG